MSWKAAKLWSIVLVLGLGFVLLGCQPALCPIAPDVVHFSRKYQEERDFLALRWLEENVLRKDQPRAYVELLLGYGSDPHTGDEYECRMYRPDQDAPTVPFLLIRYRKGVVRGWEWASE